MNQEYLKLFKNQEEYDAAATKPVVSHLIEEVEIIMESGCDVTTTYELVGTPTYPSTIECDESSFNLSFNYRKTIINEDCSQAITEGSETATIQVGENPYTSSTRTIEGTYYYHGLEIQYSLVQNKCRLAIIGTFDITDTENPTKVAYSVNSFTEIEIDGIKQSSMTTGYTFSTVGEHTVKYYLYNNYMGYSTFYGCNRLIDVIIPNGVNTITSQAFQYCTNLESIELPDSITTISNSAFTSCHKLESATIPNSVTYVGECAFWYCQALTSCTMSTSATYIGKECFYFCTGLTSIDLPSGLTTISSQLFKSCTNLKRVNSDVDGEVNIPSGVTSIEPGAFGTCVSIKSISIPDTVTSIGDSAFAYCGLIDIVVPDGVTVISFGFINSSSSLTGITFGNSVTSVKGNAFNGCTSLRRITITTPTAPATEQWTFYTMSRGGTLYVPAGSSGYEAWMSSGSYNLGTYGWSKVEI